jgi:glyoxylase-like metal-dependent hydrolase (beta-lactamase superfamily II)
MEGLRGGSVYLLASGEGLTLVDSGVIGDGDRIVAQLEQAGHAPSDVHTVVLTHAHGDHTGTAAELARRTSARIVAHRDEVPYIEQTGALPAASTAQRLMLWLADRVMYRLAPCRVDRVVKDGDVLDALGGTRVIHMPGHTPGSIGLYQPERRILFCGDALFNANPMTGRPGLRLPPRFISVDSAQACDSVRRLSEMDVQVLCCGHGEPILDRATERMRALLHDGGA